MRIPTRPIVAQLHNVRVKGDGDARILGNDEGGVSLQVRQGERVLINGPSGSGKSTLLRVMTGIVPPTAGQVELFGQDIQCLPERDRSKLIAKHVGVGFQAPNLDDGFSVLDNITTLAQTTRHGRRDYTCRIARIVTDLGLFGADGSMLEQSAHTLSGGQKQRVALARLLLPQPELLFLDEPTASLDSDGAYGKRHTYGVLESVVTSDGSTLVVVSHDEAAVAIASRVVTMRDGIIVSDTLLPVLDEAAFTEAM